MPIDAPQSVNGGSTRPRTGVFKRSLVIAGHRTSISLEDAFWRELQVLAKQRSQSINALVAEIDAGRGRANLSSAIRVFVFESAIQ
ncbi:MAG: ribbon-helix-helix domain-containing protein [Roseiarcus sp.]|jgi:predicted DNA-binding ribbon-helix-helix protein